MEEDIMKQKLEFEIFQVKDFCYNLAINTF